MMEKDFLKNILEQNKMTCSFSFDQITKDNANFRLNTQAASVKFIYRHIAETINLFPTFYGIPTSIQNTTMGVTDTGQGEDIEESRQLIMKGYNILFQLIEDSANEDWLTFIDTPFFGKVTRLRLFAHILFHNSHHCGQISLALSRGSNIA